MNTETHTHAPHQYCSSPPIVQQSLLKNTPIQKNMCGHKWLTNKDKEMREHTNNNTIESVHIIYQLQEPSTWSSNTCGRKSTTNKRTRSQESSSTTCRTSQKHRICTQVVKMRRSGFSVCDRGSRGVSVVPMCTEESDFGQSRFGHPDLTNFGQSNFGQSIFGHRGFGPANYGQSQFWPIQFWPIQFWPIQGVMVGPPRVGGQTQKKWGPEVVGPKGGAPKGGAPKGGAPKGGGPKFRAFFPSPATVFYSFLPLFWSFSWNFGGV